MLTQRDNKRGNIWYNRKMKIKKKQIEKIKKRMLIEIKPAKISKQKFLNALYGRKRMQMKGIAKKTGIGIQFK